MFKLAKTAPTRLGDHGDANLLQSWWLAEHGLDTTNWKDDVSLVKCSITTDDATTTEEDMNSLGLSQQNVQPRDATELTKIRIRRMRICKFKSVQMRMQT